jgi:nucleolar protein 4
VLPCTQPSHAIRAERAAERPQQPAPAPEAAVVPAASTHSAPAKSADPNAIRTLVLTGLPKDLDKNTLWKKIRKLDGVEKKDDLVYPVEKGTGEDGVANEAIGGMGDVGESPLSYVFVSPISLTMHSQRISCSPTTRKPSMRPRSSTLTCTRDHCYPAY